MPAIELDGQKYEFDSEDNLKTFVQKYAEMKGVSSAAPSVQSQPESDSIPQKIAKGIENAPWYIPGAAPVKQGWNLAKEFVRGVSEGGKGFDEEKSFGGKLKKAALASIPLDPFGAAPDYNAAIARNFMAFPTLGQTERLSALAQMPFSDMDYSQLVAKEKLREQKLGEKFPETSQTAMMVGAMIPSALTSGIPAAISRFAPTLSKAPELLKVLGMAGLNVAEGQMALPEWQKDQAGMTALMDTIASLVMPSAAKALGYTINKGSPLKPNLRSDLYEAQQQLKSTTGEEIPLSVGSLLGAGAPDETVAKPLIEGTESFLKNFAPGSEYSTLAKNQLESAQKALDVAGGKGLGRKIELNPQGVPVARPFPKVESERVVNDLVEKRNAEVKNTIEVFEPIYRELDNAGLDNKFNINHFANFIDTINRMDNELKLGLGNLYEKGSIISERVFNKFLKPGQIDLKDPKTYRYNEITGERTPIPVQTNFQDIHQLRKDLNRIERESNNEGMIAAAKQLRGALDSDIDSIINLGLKNVDAPLFSKLRDVDSAYRARIAETDIPLLNNIVELSKEGATPFASKGERILNTAVRKNNYEDLVKIKALVGPEKFQAFSDSMWQHFTRGKEDSYDIFPKNAGDNPLARRLSGVDRKTLELIVGKQRADTLYALKQIAPYLSDVMDIKIGKPSKVSKLSGGLGAVGLGTIGAITSGVTAGITGFGIPLVGLMKSKFAAKLFTDPKYVKHLIRISNQPFGKSTLQRTSRTLVRMFEYEESGQSETDKKSTQSE